MARELHLNVNVTGSGRHAGGWRAQDDPTLFVNIDFFRRIARVRNAGRSTPCSSGPATRDPSDTDSTPDTDSKGIGNKGIDSKGTDMTVTASVDPWFSRRSDC